MCSNKKYHYSAIEILLSLKKADIQWDAIRFSCIAYFLKNSVTKPRLKSAKQGCILPIEFNYLVVKDAIMGFHYNRG